jgi:hypothetical protein
VTAAAEQPRDEAGRFSSYVRPPVPPRRRPVAVPAVRRRPALEEQDTQPVPYVVRRLSPEVPESVVAVCCPECVYGDLD